jgi:hypothetical protein
MPKFVLHTIFLITAVILAFAWTSQPTLSLYTLQLIALFVLLFFANQWWNRHVRALHAMPLQPQSFDAVILTLIIILLVASTGGLTSPLFFLVYFLMFGLSLLFEPPITISLALAISILFLLSPTEQSVLTEIIQLGSLVMITPLALFFGKQYLKVLEQQEKIQILEEEEQIAEKELQQQETDVLLWTTIDLKKSLYFILDQTSHLLTDLSHLSVSQRERLQKIYQQTLNLLKSSSVLKKEIEENE